MNGMPGRSITARLILQNWLTVLILVLVFSTLSVLTFYHQADQKYNDFLKLESSFIQDQLESLQAREGAETPVANVLPPINALLAQRVDRPLPYKTTLAILSQAGELLTQSNRAINLQAFSGQMEPGQIYLFRNQEWNFRALKTRFVLGQTNTGFFVLAIQNEAFDSEVASFLQLSVFLWAAILVFMGLLGTWLVKRTLQEINSVAVKVKEISSSRDLNQRLPVPAGRDEFAELTNLLNSLLERLAKDVQFQESLVKQVSHQVKTPLTIIRSLLEKLYKLPGLPSGSEPLLGDTFQELLRVEKLISSLLKISHWEMYQPRGEPRTVSLDGIFHKIFEELAPLWEEKKIAVHYIPQSSLVKIWTEDWHLEEAFKNILINAYKFVPTGGFIQIRITEGTKQTDVAFVNNGPPLSEADLEHLFEMFYQGTHPTAPDKPASEPFGVSFGLGLYIVKLLIEKNDGRVAACNPEGGGAQFTISLPR